MTKCRKICVALSGVLLSVIAQQAQAQDCFALYTPNLIQDGRRSLEQSITDIGNVQKMLSCLNMPAQASSLNSAKNRIDNAIRRRNTSSGKMCGNQPGRNFTMQYGAAINPEALFSVRPGSAVGGIITQEQKKKQGHDGEVIINHEYGVASVFPAQSEIGKNGAVYIAGSNPSGDHVFFQANGEPFIPSSSSPRCVKTRTSTAAANATSANAEAGIKDAITRARAAGQTQMVASLEKMLEQRRANMRSVSTNRADTTGGSSNCTDTPQNQTPPPFFRGRLPERIDFVKKLGIDGNWCSRSGVHQIWVGYGALSDADEREISEMRNFGAQTLGALTLAQREATARGETKYAAEIGMQINQYKNLVAEYLASKRNADPALFRMYNNGRLEGTCWSVATYRCPSSSGGGGKK